MRGGFDPREATERPLGGGFNGFPGGFLLFGYSGPVRGVSTIRARPTQAGPSTVDPEVYVVNPMNPTRVVRWGVAAGLVAAAVAVEYSASSIEVAPVLHASKVVTSPDTDGDGLPNLVEDNLGTSRNRPDSDGDGYWDAEEVARQSNPLDPKDIPQAAPASLGMGVYELGKEIRPVIALYVADGNVRSTTLKMGVRVGQTLRTMPLSFFTNSSTVVKTPTVNAQSTVLVLDAKLDSRVVHAYGNLSIYSTLDYRGSTLSADALDMFSTGGVIAQTSITAFHSASLNPTLKVGQGVAGVYQPLGGGGTSSPPPSNWKSGKVCSQGMVVVGVVGAVVIQEVMNADCEAGWESYCDPVVCSSSVGGMVQMVDPVALIGG